MKELIVTAVVAVAATLVVQRHALDLELIGHDPARLVRAHADGEVPGLEALPHERDVGPLLYRAAVALYGGSARRMVIGSLALLIVAAVLAASAVRRLMPAHPKPDRSLMLDAGIIVAVLWPAVALHFDAVQALPGQVALVGAVWFAANLRLAVWRPGALTLLAGPLAASLVFRESLGLTFLALPAIVLVADPRARAAWRGPAGLGYLLLAAAAGRIVWAVAGGEPVGAREPGGPTGAGWLATLARDAAALAVPFPPSPRLSGGAVWAQRASFALVLAGLTIWGAIAMPASHRRLALAGGAGLLAALALAALRPPPGADLAGGRELAIASFALVLVLACAADAAARRGTTEILALGLAVFYVYTSMNAAGEMRWLRDRNDGREELRLIGEKLEDVAHDAPDILLLGLPAEPARAAAATALIAREHPPFSGRHRRRRLRVAVEGSCELLPSGLIASDQPTTICEWKPRTLLQLRERPHGWVVGLELVGRAEPANGVLRLIAPENEATRTTARPESIAEDMSFTFETAPGFVLGKERAFVFYAIYEGGRTPKGRHLLSGRVLPPAVLTSTRRPDGSTRHVWRAAVRPGSGHDGIYFEDPDLDLAGRPMWWTVGVARGSGGHEGHDHAAPEPGETGPSIRHPEHVAQTRRIWFMAPGADGS